MARTRHAWARWKELARRAAVFQSNVLLWLLYYLVVVPLGLVRFPFLPHAKDERPAWRERPLGSGERIATARRQF